MKKTLLTLVFGAFAFVSAFAQTLPVENIYWKNTTENSYVYASAGVAHFFLLSTPPGNGDFQDAYVIKTDTVTFAPILSPLPICTGSGSYKMFLTNDTLSFVLISDDCSTRSGNVVGSKWTQFFPTGLEENALSSLIKVYPNPAVGSFHVEMPASNGRLSLYDAKGTNVMDKALNAMNNTISTESLTKGIYHAQIMVDGKWIKTSTIVVQ